MLEKIRSGLNLFILFMFVVAFIYGIVIIITNAINSEKINNMNPITTQNVDIYLTENYLLKTDYNTFFTLEDCIQDVITSLHDNKLSDVYNILIGDLKNTIGNDKTKLTEYYNKNFKYEFPDNMSFYGYQNVNNLKQVYKVDKNTYICVVTSINESKLTKIGIKLIDSETYLVSYIEI